MQLVPTRVAKCPAFQPACPASQSHCPASFYDLSGSSAIHGDAAALHLLSPYPTRLLFHTRTDLNSDFSSDLENQRFT